MKNCVASSVVLGDGDHAFYPVCLVTSCVCTVHIHLLSVLVCVCACICVRGVAMEGREDPVADYLEASVQCVMDIHRWVGDAGIWMLLVIGDTPG